MTGTKRGLWLGVLIALPIIFVALIWWVISTQSVVQSVADQDASPTPAQIEFEPPVQADLPEIEATVVETDAAAAPVDPTPETAVAAVLEIDPPSFDLVRMQPNGQLLVAGRADTRTPEVTILLQGDMLISAQATTDGSFVGITTVAASAQPRMLQLFVLHPETGERVFAENRVFLGPTATPEPVQMAELAETPTTPETGPETGVDTGEPASEGDPVETAETDASEDGAQPPAIAATPDAEGAEPGDESSTEGAMGTSQIAEIADETTEPATTDPATGEAETVQADEASDPAATQTETATDAGEAGADAAGAGVIADAGGETPAPTTDGTAQAAQSTETPDAGVQSDPAENTIIIAGADGVRVVQGPSDLQPEATLALDVISYTQAGEVSIGGRSASGGFVRVYLDNAPITTSRIREDGSWSTELPQVDTGVYTLRVDEVTQEGDVVARVETPFQRESPEALQELSSSNPDLPPGMIEIRTVQPGMTLWEIAEENYGDGNQYLKVFEANKDRIRDPDLIYPGQLFDVPE